MQSIPFNKPYLTGKEHEYIHDAMRSGKLSGDGAYTKRCHQFLEERFGFAKCLLTTSCTAALEMAALLIGIQPGDEVIMPSYTFVSTANAFVLRGAKIVFADSRPDHPGIDESKLEALITSRTRAIVPVHYAGVAADMDVLMALADKYNLFIIEDAAQAIDSYYTGKDGVKRPLGSIGHLAAFSFHDTKNIISGEGGMLVVNDPSFLGRAEIIREMGTDRSRFLRGEVDKYGWVDLGSSFLPSDMIAAFLLAQLEHLDAIQQMRRNVWDHYYEVLSPLQDAGLFTMPAMPSFATNNAQMFYLVCKDTATRNKLISVLKEHNIQAVFHYLSLHRSDYFAAQHDGRHLTEADRYSGCLLRLPLFCGLDSRKVTSVIKDGLHRLTS
jgi:dTDP-4-amino-4,6-dideoxygalactose transaminase